MKTIFAALVLVAWGCGSSSSPLAELRAGRHPGLAVTLIDERKLIFRANEYRFVPLDSAFAIVGKCTQIEDRFGPTSIVLTDSIPSSRIDDISGYGADASETPGGK